MAANIGFTLISLSLKHPRGDFYSTVHVPNALKVGFYFYEQNSAYFKNPFSNLFQDRDNMSHSNIVDLLLHPCHCIKQ